MNPQALLSLWYVRALIVIILIGAAAALFAYTNLTAKQAKYSMMGPTTISVRGEGEVLARPDIGQFSFAVRAEGEDAATAQELSAESTNGIIEYLKEAGVEEKDIKTQNYNLHPRYRYEERVCVSGSFCPPGEQIIDGYEVSQSVVVKVRDLDQAGDLISGVGERGATNISGLQFTIDDETVLKAEARAEAIADAKEKAKQLAEDLDVRLVRMVGFWEDEGGFYPEPYFGGVAEMAMDSSVAKRGTLSVSTPVGENEIKSTVNITYEIR